MCRLLLMNKKAFEELETLDIMDYLQHQCGGHGNGYILVKDGRIVSIDKGINLSNKSIVKTASKKDFDYILYHTRVTSAGSIKDSNCHPFWNKDKSFALMMNGTEQSFAQIGRSIDKTDTELVFEMIRKNIVPFNALKELTANYIGFKRGNVFAVNNSSYNCLQVIDEDGILCIASALPREMEKDFDIKEMEIKSVWLDGEDIPVRKRFEYKKKETLKVNGVEYTRAAGGGWEEILNEQLNEIMELNE